MISRTCAAVRSGRSRLSANASSSIPAGVRSGTTRGRGTSASNPPWRYARIHSSSVPRATLTGRPSGPTCSRSAIARTSRPRSRLDRPGSAASRTSAYRNRPVSRRLSTSVRAGRSLTRRVTLSADHAHGKAGTRVANNPPPDNLDTTGHGSAGPNRNAHARAATAITSSPSAMPLPAGITGPSSGSSATAHRVKWLRNNSARSANRRSQPRTVSAGTPRPRAIRRYPMPETLAVIAAPITDTSSWRRNKHTSGNNTCVAAQPRHRARRGRSRRSPDRHRNTRVRA